jgi:hypothetical protein
MKKTKQVQLFEEEENWSHPPFLALYGINGEMVTYYIYNSEF